jgi:plasmid stabilization system protein ParE
MGRRIAVKPEVVLDLDEQFDYYEGKGTPDTVDHWLNQAHATFRFLATQPGIGATYRPRDASLAGLRRRPVDGFENHYVYYLTTADGIEVIRVLSGYRNVRRFL